MAEQPIRKWKWTKKRSKAALLLAEGYTQHNVAKMLELGTRTIERWCGYDVFDAEVDRLTLMRGIAGRAERVRIAKRAVRQEVQEAGVQTKRDVLDWLKFVQSETDGINLNLTALFTDALALAGSGQAGDGAENPGETRDADAVAD